MRIQQAKIFVLVMTLAGFLFIGAVFFFLTLPTLREVNALSRKITDAETEVQAQYANRKNLLGSIAKIAAARTSLQTIGAQFAQPGKELDFITAIEDVAEKNGVQSNLRLDLTVGKQQLEELNRGFELSLTGPFQPALRTLVDLQRLPIILAIETIQIQGSGFDVAINLRGLIASPPKGL